MIEWPENLRFFVLEDGQRSERGENVLRSQMDVGPPQRRRRSTLSVPHMEAKTQWLTRAEADQIRDFYYDDLASGVLPFRVKDRYTGKMTTMAFWEGFDEELNGVKHRFSATFEILPS